MVFFRNYANRNNVSKRQKKMPACRETGIHSILSFVYSCGVSTGFSGISSGITSGIVSGIVCSAAASMSLDSPATLLLPLSSPKLDKG